MKFILETPQGTASDSFSMDAWTTVDSPTHPDVLIIDAVDIEDAVNQAQSITGAARYTNGNAAWETAALHSFSVRSQDDAAKSYSEFIA